VFSTRPGYDDAASQQAVLDVLRTALCDDAFLKAFAGALVRYEGPWASAQVPASPAACEVCYTTCSQLLSTRIWTAECHDWVVGLKDRLFPRNAG